MIRYFLLIFILIFLPSCEDTDVLMMTNAASDAVNAITLTDEDVKSLAVQTAQASDTKYHVAPKNSVYDARLGRLIADYRNRDANTFNFKVYLTNEVNAFAMADGSIRVYSGLMDLMTDEELLFVIGHEMGHVVEKHSRNKVVLAYASSALRKGLASQNNEVGMVARSMLGGLVEKLTHAQFSQHEERQADQYGLAFLKAEGYDRRDAVSALNKLAVLASQHTFLSSHPDPEARAKILLSGEKSEDEQQNSTIATLLSYGKEVLFGCLQLMYSLMNWLLSFL